MVLEETDPHDDGDRENYFVSMTDMMVGMLFIFIILLMSFALAFRQQTDVQVDKTKEQTDKIKIAVDVGQKLDELENSIRARLDEIRQANQLRLRLLMELTSQLSRDRLTVEISPSGDVLRLTEQAVRFTPEYGPGTEPVQRFLERVSHAPDRQSAKTGLSPDSDGASLRRDIR
jgi:hypothetical protein